MLILWQHITNFQIVTFDANAKKQKLKNRKDKFQQKIYSFVPSSTKKKILQFLSIDHWHFLQQRLLNIILNSCKKVVSFF